MPRSKKYDREEVLERAMHAFWSKGYSATSVSDLVEQTGLNRFSLYNEFENKDDLYRAAFEKYRHTVMEDRMSALEQEDDGIECLRRFFMDYISGVKDGLKVDGVPVSCLSMLNAVERIGREPETSKTTKSIFKRMETAFGVVLRRALALKEINQESRLRDYAVFLVGCTYGLDVMSKYKSRGELNAYVETVLASLK